MAIPYKKTIFWSDMEIKICWEEMKRRYPNEWLLITDYDTDESGHIHAGIVAQHSVEKKARYIYLPIQVTST